MVLDFNIFCVVMMYFINSTRKDDGLKHPITIMSGNKRRAYAYAVLKFKEWGYKGSPKFV
jgi:hypothetical protein